MDEILKLVKNEIRKSDYYGEYTFGIVLTGGGAQLEHISDLAQEIFKQPIKIGKPPNESNDAVINNDIKGDLAFKPRIISICSSSELPKMISTHKNIAILAKLYDIKCKIIPLTINLLKSTIIKPF